MLKDFDAVVIGAGLGGISAATSLAKAGKRVLLMEKHNVPGGYASSFLRGRFEFEVALHELSGLGNEENPGPIWKLLKGNEVARRVEFLYMPEVLRGYYPDFDITLPIGREKYTETLCRQFPGEADGLRKFMDIMWDFADQALKANRIGMKAVMQDASTFTTLMTYYGKTLSQVLNPLVADEKARAVIGQTWGYYCQPPSKLSFLIHCLGTVSYIKFGPSHIRGTSQCLSQGFIDIFEEYGGQTWFNTGAKHILTSRGRIKGVLADDGTEIATPYVVCNANPVTAVLQLLGRDKVPSWYLERIGAWGPGASTVNVYAGLDCDSREVGLTVHENFISTSYDLDGQYYNMKKSVDFEPDGIALTAYNIADKTLSPPGTSSIVITAIAYAEPWLKLKPAEYHEAKQRLAGKMIKLADKVAPGLSQHIETVDVATPLTNIRYTNNPGGSIIGFDENYTGTAMDHLPMKGPVEGLYFAGAWVNIGGGFEPCMASGVLAARSVLSDMERGRWEDGTIDKLKEQAAKQTPGAHELKNPLAAAGRTVTALHPGSLSLKVKEVIRETASAKTLRLVSDNGKLPFFRAGQYVNLFVKAGKTLTSRPYSIASAPGKSYIDLTVRRVEKGFVSRYLLNKVKEGDRLESTAPNGTFYYEPLTDTDSLVFLAGGSGITPFMSIIRQAVSKILPLNIHLLYGSRKPGDIIFKKELDRIAARNPNIRVDYIISEPPTGWSGLTGFLDAQVIAELVGSVRDKTFFICGPAPMYALCGHALESLGIPPRRVKKEVYGPLLNVVDEPGWPKDADTGRVFSVIEERTGRKIKAKACEPLMVALERHGIVIPAVCRSGECTACRTRLISGKVFIPERVHRRQADLKSGYIHPCMTYPLDDLHIRI
ncbi:MAG: NAD(P)-binding protein [Dehalococcoidia bacterium]|nr:NAD(P)-binding protein [Dehalococcoidia bacterium]